MTAALPCSYFGLGSNPDSQDVPVDAEADKSSRTAATSSPHPGGDNTGRISHAGDSMPSTCGSRHGCAVVARGNLQSASAQKCQHWLCRPMSALWDLGHQ
jgi:hypothetical protein